MALSEEPASSGSLVRSRHRLGRLLAYFLGPGTTWELQFKDVVTQVLKENLRHVDKRCTDAASSLRKCNKRWTQLRTEFDATSKAMQVVANAPSSREMEHRLSSLQTSLTVIERSIMRYENIIEDCRMQEEEAHQEEEISHKQEEEEVTNAEVVDEEERGDPGPSDPQGRLILRTPLLWILLVMLSPLRRMPSSCSRHPNPWIQPLDLTAPGARPVWSRERWPI